MEIFYILELWISIICDRRHRYHHQYHHPILIISEAYDSTTDWAPDELFQTENQQDCISGDDNENERQPFQRTYQIAFDNAIIQNLLFERALFAFGFFYR